VDFEDLFEEYYDKIYIYIFRRVSSSHDAEDLTADVFIKVFECRLKPLNIGAYLYATAANTVKNHYRRAAIRKNVVLREPEHELPDDTDILGDVITFEECAKLQDALTVLPKRDYDVVYHRYYLDESYKEIGEALGITEPGARKIHERALKKLEKVFI